jgi:hypothetical protein
MAVNLRAVHAARLKTTLEGPFGLPVVLIDPDGNEQSKSAEEPEKDLKGQVLYDHREVDPDTGAEITVNTPVITLRIAALNRVPVDDEPWIVKIPLTPDPEAPKESFITLGRPVEGGPSIGFIRLYPQLMEEA